MFDNAGKAAACGSKAPGGAVDTKCLLPGKILSLQTVRKEEIPVAMHETIGS